MEDTIGPSFKLFEKYESNVHKSTDNVMKDYKDFLVESPLKVRLIVCASNQPHLKLTMKHTAPKNLVDFNTKLFLISAP